jgi:predicted nucleotidyltransferase
MTTISFDFSHKAELSALAHIVRDLKAVAEPMGIPFFLMGAMARDLMLLYAHGIDTGRQTKDVDFSVMVGGWDAFSALRSELIESATFSERQGAAGHRLRHTESGLPLDMLPFGRIETADRKISWPPEHSTVFNCLGMAEALEASVSISLPEGVALRVASIPALALLKVCAWQERKWTDPGKDAGDLLLYMREYLNCGNLDRATTEHKDLFEAEAYDYTAAGAQLLGRDIALLLDGKAKEYVLAILRPQADEQGPLILAGQAGRNPEQARKLVAAVCRGLIDRG